MGLQEVKEKYAGDMSVVVDLFFRLGFDQVPPQEFATLPLNEDDPEIAELLRLARKALKAGKNKAFGELRAIPGANPTVYEVITPGTDSKLVLALDAARPGLLELSPSARNTAPWGEEMVHRLKLFAVRVGVSPFQAGLLMYSETRRPWNSGYSAEGALPYTPEVQSIFDARVTAQVISTQGTEFANSMLKDNGGESLVYSMWETSLHLIREAGATPTEMAYLGWRQFLLSGDEVAIRDAATIADPFMWERVEKGLDFPPSSMADVLPVLLRRGFLSENESHSLLVRMLGNETRPGGLKTLALILSDAEDAEHLPVDMVPPDMVRTYAPELVPVLGRGQADMARYLGPRLMKHAGDEDLPNVVAALLSVKARNARVEVLKAGLRRSGKPEASLRSRLHVLLQDLIANDGNAKFTELVGEVVSAWGLDENSDGAPELSDEEIAAEAAEIYAEEKRERLEKIEAGRAGRPVEKRLCERSFEEVWKVPQESYPILEDAVGMTLHGVEGRYGRGAGWPAGRASWRLEFQLPNHARTGEGASVESGDGCTLASQAREFFVEEVYRFRTLIVRAGAITDAENPNRIDMLWSEREGFEWEFRGAGVRKNDLYRDGFPKSWEWGEPWTLPGRNWPLPPSMIAALMMNWVELATSKRDVIGSDVPVVEALSSPELCWQSLLPALAFDDVVIELVMRRLALGEGTSPQPLLWLLRRNHASVGVFWPIWTVLLDKAVDGSLSQGDGSLPRWATAVAADMHEARGHLAEAVTRGLADPERIIGRGLREIALRPGKAVTIQRAREIIEAIEAAHREA